MKTFDDVERAGETRGHGSAECAVPWPMMPFTGQRRPGVDADRPVAPMPAEACTEIGFEAGSATDPLTQMETRLAWMVVVGSGVALISMVAALLPW